MSLFIVHIALYLALGLLFGHLFAHLVKHEAAGTRYEWGRHGVVLVLSLSIGITISETDHPYDENSWAGLALWVVLLGSMVTFAWAEGRRQDLW